MALINCPECGKEISNTAKRCIHCGYNLKKGTKENKKVFTIVIISIAVVILIFVIILAVIGSCLLVKNLKKKKIYNSAETLYSEGDFEGAAEIFLTLGSYSDSEERAKECYYNLGSEWEKKGYYGMAATMYEKGGYIELAEKATSEKEKIDNEKAAELQAKQEEQRIAEEKFEKKDKLKQAVWKTNSKHTKLSNDGLSITIDSTDENDIDSMLDVFIVIDYLGFPDSVSEKIKNTNSRMGLQSETYDGYKITWSYHPKNGLDAIIEIIE